MGSSLLLTLPHIAPLFQHCNLESWGGWPRTSNLPVNSRALCQLSYTPGCVRNVTVSGLLFSMAESSVDAIILAAGKATRFGSEKLTVPYQGRPLVAHAMAATAAGIAAGTLRAGFVIYRPEAAMIAKLAHEAGLEPVPNPRADHGIAESLRVGLAAAGSRPGTAAVLVMPGDQPHVRLEVMHRLIQTWRNGKGPVIRPRYEEDPGSPNHPVLLDASIWPLVAELTGDTGFSQVLERRPELVATIDVAGRNPDVDTPQDLLSSLP